ncbi:MAG: glutathione binding-like protein [Pseudomonadota bacterium]
MPTISKNDFWHIPTPRIRYSNIWTLELPGGKTHAAKIPRTYCFSSLLGNANHFKNYAKNIADDPAQLVYGEKRFVGEVDRLCGVMDAQLGVHQYLAGSDYTIADIVTWPWARLVGRLIEETMWETFPNVKRWVDEVGERPAVDRGFRRDRDWSRQERTEEEEKARRELLFNQTNQKVRAAREAAVRAG